MKEVKENLKEALEMVLEVNRMMVEKERPRGRAIKQKMIV